MSVFNRYFHDIIVHIISAANIVLFFPNDGKAKVAVNGNGVAVKAVHCEPDGRKPFFAAALLHLRAGLPGKAGAAEAAYTPMDAWSKPILAGLDISIVSSSTVILTSAVKVILCFTAIRLPKVMPELWNKSKFHVGKGLLNVLCIVGGLVATFQVVLMLATSAPLELAGNLAILVVSVIYALAVNRRVRMEVSYEDCD